MARKVTRRAPVPVQMPRWMPKVHRILGCPEGLEYLCAVDQLLVHQQLQLLELFLPYEQKNKFVVKNTMGQFIFLALEESDLFSRCCLGELRPFEMKIMDYRNVEVLRFVRPLRCDWGLFFCCLPELQVYAPPETLIGSVKMTANPCFPTFLVLDSDQKEVLWVQGPLITSACCNDVVFDIYCKGGTIKLGMVSKNWSGACREAATDIDNFTLVFPLDLDVKVKAVLLGTLILIDILMFETSPTGTQLDLPGNLIG